MTDLRNPGELPSLDALKELGDGDLVRLLVRGRDEAMTVVFDRYYAPMMRLALRILRNRSEAEDVVQIAFVDFYRQIKLFDESKGNLRAWLLQYLYGRAINRFNLLKVRHHADHVELSDVPQAELASSQESILDLNEPESKVFVEQILATLNDHNRRVVEMVCLDGMTFREVALLTREPRPRIQSRYYRAIAELRASARETEELQGLSPKLQPAMEKEGRKSPANMTVVPEEVELG